MGYIVKRSDSRLWRTTTARVVEGIARRHGLDPVVVSYRLQSGGRMEFRGLVFAWRRPGKKTG